MEFLIYSLIYIKTPPIKIPLGCMGHTNPLHPPPCKQRFIKKKINACFEVRVIKICICKHMLVNEKYQDHSADFFSK